jgi:hypothetical protein
MVLLIIIPIKWLFHWEYTLFSDKPMLFKKVNFVLSPIATLSPYSPGLISTLAVPGTERGWCWDLVPWPVILWIGFRGHLQESPKK